MRRYLRAGWIRVALTSAGVALLLAGATGCWLFNVPPTAAFTVSAQAGQAPFTVNFSAALSDDEDGEIVEYKWDFGDGQSGVGETVSHTYTQAGTYTVVLIVSDDRGATARTSKNIFVTPPPPAGPTASFTASPTSGTSPMTVNVNASASSYPSGVIEQYEWDWDDGTTSSGINSSRTYYVITTRTFTITLTVRTTDGKVATATQTITVNAAGTATGPTPAPGDPRAQFKIDIPRGVAPLKVTFDPSDSKASAGRSIVLYTWSFGDGGATSDINPNKVSHVYLTSEESTVFTVRLLVLDNEGASNSITKTVVVQNHRPIAGFEIRDPGDDSKWLAEAIPDFVTFSTQTPSVTIRSKEIPTTGVTRHWGNLWSTESGAGVTPLEQKDLRQARNILATARNAPTAPPDYSGNNFSYDPEGQTWHDGQPLWFPAGGAWGIKYLHIDWGYPGGQETRLYAPAGTVVAHNYGGVALHGTPFDITVIAEDGLGQRSAPFRRRVEFRD